MTVLRVYIYTFCIFTIVWLTIRVLQNPLFYALFSTFERKNGTLIMTYTIFKFIFPLLYNHFTSGRPTEDERDDEDSVDSNGAVMWPLEKTKRNSRRMYML